MEFGPCARSPRSPCRRRDRVDGPGRRRLQARVTAARSSWDGTAPVATPFRSRATCARICFLDKPRFLAFPPRPRGGRGMPDRLPLNDAKMNASPASTLPVSLAGLSTAEAARNRCRQRNAVPNATPQRLADLARLSPRTMACAWSAQRSFFRGPASDVPANALKPRRQSTRQWRGRPAERPQRRSVRLAQ